MVGFLVRSTGMLVVWTGLLMVFTSAGGSLLMLVVLAAAVCGAALLAAYARRGLAGTVRILHLLGSSGASSTARSSPVVNRWGP